jgi:predicted DNA-binding protein (MmcQ/YjbR family)
LFALLDVDAFQSVNLKCDPEYALDLRERFSAVRPGYHMNKRHWITVDVNGDVSDELLLQLTKHSYELVFKSLTKREQHDLQNR